MIDESSVTIQRVRRKGCCFITIEPVGFLFLCASIIQSIVIQNLYLKKACLVNFGLNETECHGHHENIDSHDEDNEVQRYVSNLNIYGSLIENIPNILLVLCLGPWSDANGRKVPMTLPLIGHILSVTLYITNYHFESWPAEYILIASIPLGIFGGNPTLIMAFNSYISDITTTEWRTSRLSFLYGCLAIAFPVGSFVSIYIYTAGGYIAIWATSLGLATLALVYLACCVTDSRTRNSSSNEGSINTLTADLVGNPSTEDEDKPSCWCITTVISNLWECFTVTFRPRDGYERSCIFLLLACMCIYVCGVPTSVSYLFTRKLFGWDQPQYSLYGTIASCITIVGGLILLPLLSYYGKVNDVFLGMLSVAGSATGALVAAFAVSPLMFYLAAIGYIFNSSTPVIIRSMLSKIVISEELSHVYAVLASLESIMPLISSTLYNLVYEATIDAFPGCVYALVAGLLLIIFVLFSTVCLLQWRERVNGQVMYNAMTAASDEDIRA